MISIKRIVDYKKVDMVSEEWEYYNKLVNEFSIGNISGSEYFHDIFDADDEGYIYMIRPPLGKEVPWAIIIFLQNLMLNQNIRKMNKLFESKMQKLEELIGENNEQTSVG